MQNIKVLSLTTLLLLAASLATARLLPRLQTGVQRVPIDDLPRTLADWTSGPDIAADAEIQARLPTAHILERNYTSPAGKTINLMLVTASDDEDFHNPTACLPAQGWTLRERETMRVRDEPVRVVTATREQDRFFIFYYWVKARGPNPPPGSVLATALGLRKRIVHEDLALFVRVAIADAPQNRPDLTRFASLVWQALQPILGPHPEVVLRG